MVTATLLKWLMRGDKMVCNISSLIGGHYGLNDVALSVPTLIGEKGIKRIIEVKMTSGEREKLEHSAQILQKAIESVA